MYFLEYYTCIINIYKFCLLHIFFHFLDYVTIIKQAVHERRSSECPSYRSAALDISVLNEDVPVPLTQNFEHFEKAALIRRHSSRYARR